MKLFDDRDQKDCKRIARAKSYADGQKGDSDNDPRVVALQHAVWGDLDFTDGHTFLPNDESSVAPPYTAQQKPLWSRCGE
ncbi:MAG: hypothetical protein ACREV8_14135, partial [Gammaproteobacteria bacterium]